MFISEEGKRREGVLAGTGWTRGSGAAQFDESPLLVADGAQGARSNDEVAPVHSRTVSSLSLLPLLTRAIHPLMLDKFRS